MKKIMNKIKILSLTTIISFFAVNSFSENTKKDCTKIKNIFKKVTCNINIATSKVNEKKTLKDWIKKEK